MAENILKKGTGHEIFVVNTAKEIITNEENEIDKLPKIFTKRIENENKYIGGFIYICENVKPRVKITPNGVEN